MKLCKSQSFAVLAALLVISLPSPSRAAEARTEAELIAVLQSSAPAVEKNAACWQLKRTGTAQSVPALAALLPDEALSHSARYALESMPWPEAGVALVKALEKTAGLTRIGVIQSVGDRREAAAVPVLSRLLAETDVPVKVAAATALGQIAGPDAESSLQAAKARLAAEAAADVRQAILDGLLRCAQHCLEKSDREHAFRIYEALYQDQASQSVHLAAYRGAILASEPHIGLGLIVGLLGTGGPAQAAALALVPEFKAELATTSFAGVLPKASSTLQIALLGCLAQRGDVAAAPAIAALLKAPDARVRTAALAALGTLNAVSNLLAIAEAAGSATGEEQAAARQALSLLHGPQCAEAMLKALLDGPPAVQVELARALGERGEKSAVPRLLGIAGRGSESAQKAARLALARLAGVDQLPALIAVYDEVKTDTARAEVVDSVNQVCQRLWAGPGHFDTTPVVQAVSAGVPPRRAAFLTVCSGLPEARVRAALRGVLHDLPAAHDAAIRALADTTDAELTPDLFEAARSTPEENLRKLVLGGWIRLAIRDGGVAANGSVIKAPLAAQIEGLSTLGRLPGLSVEQRKVLLSGAAEVPAPETLALAEQCLAEPQLAAEAAQATIQISRSLTDSKQGAAVLRKVLAALPEGSLKQDAQAALKELDDRQNYIMAWKIAGPYLQDGKDYSALFDIPFPPETGSAALWHPIYPGTDPKRPWLLDLLKALGGEQRVAYARTYIHADKPTPAHLEFGADDGLKVWLNQKFIFGNNASRGISPGADKMDVTLEAGWNVLLIKVTQNNQGWEFCARLVKPDGSPLEGVTFDANH